jgi:hypothetical protein
VQRGLYKTEFQTVHGTGRGVLYVNAGKMLGGNSAFGFIGVYTVTGDDIAVEISTVRHHTDPNFRPLLGTDIITLTLRGQQDGEVYRFTGDTSQLPGTDFRSVMMRIDDDTLPAPTTPAALGIDEGLYAIHIRMLDGVDGGNTGVMVLHGGRIFGGDAFFDYIGSYTSANGQWRGELVNHEHTPSKNEALVFGGYEVGIGFSGTYGAQGAETEATAFVGQRSVRFRAELTRLADI